jgi:hypothetical protein
MCLGIFDLGLEAVHQLYSFPPCACEPEIRLWGKMKEEHEMRKKKKGEQQRRRIAKT